MAKVKKHKLGIQFIVETRRLVVKDLWTDWNTVFTSLSYDAATTQLLKLSEAQPDQEFRCWEMKLLLIKAAKPREPKRVVHGRFAPCCEDERRSFEGGCMNCGDPCF